MAALAIFAVRGCRKNARMRDAAGTELAGIDSKQFKTSKAVLHPNIPGSPLAAQIAAAQYRT